MLNDNHIYFSLAPALDRQLPSIRTFGFCQNASIFCQYVLLVDRPITVTAPRAYAHPQRQRNSLSLTGTCPAEHIDNFGVTSGIRDSQDGGASCFGIDLGSFIQDDLDYCEKVKIQHPPSNSKFILGLPKTRHAVNILSL